MNGGVVLCELYCLFLTQEFTRLKNTFFIYNYKIKTKASDKMIATG